MQDCITSEINGCVDVVVFTHFLQFVFYELCFIGDKETHQATILGKLWLKAYLSTTHHLLSQLYNL